MESELRRERRKKGQFEVTFELAGGEQEILTLHLFCLQSQSFYTLAIDSRFIKNHSDMASFFSDPASLLYTLSELFDELEISNSGIITVRLHLGAAKVKLTKVYELRMNPWPEGELEYFRRRLGEQQQEAAAAIAYKQEQIEFLKAKIRMNEDIIRTLKEEGQQNQLILSQLEERVIKLESELKQANKELMSSQQANLETEEQLQQLQDELDQQNQLIENTKIEDRKTAAFQQKVFSCLYDSNPHLYHFHYAYSSKGIKVIKKSQNGWSNFVSGWLLNQRDPSSFTFRMSRMRDGSLAIGVGSQTVLSCSSLEHPDFVGYLCRDGRIYENGIKKINGTPILPEQPLSITIVQGSVSWHVGGAEVGAASLPSSLNGKRLFLIVKVFWKEDEFELLF